MCGRFALQLSVAEIEEIVEKHGIQIDEISPPIDLPERSHASELKSEPVDTVLEEKTELGLTEEPTAVAKRSLNIAPHDNVYIYIRDADKHALKLMNWTLVPPFMRDSKMHPFNTRSESLHPLKGMYSCAKTNRGVVFMEGYYEWMKEGSKRIPYYIKSAKHEPLICVPVIYTENTFSIITTGAASDLKYIHSRMPVVIDFKDVDQWVDADFNDARKVLKPKQGLENYRVSTDVNKVGVDKPDLNKKIEIKPGNSFFKRKHEETERPAKIRAK